MDNSKRKLLILFAVAFFLAAIIIQLPRTAVEESQEAQFGLRGGGTTVQAVVAVADIGQHPELTAERNYNKTAFFLNKSHDFGNFKTKLIKVGFYSVYNNTSKKNLTLFRADIEATNVVSAPQTFHSEEAFIRAPPNKYNYLKGSFDGINVTPSETRDGYILFDEVPKNITGNIELIIGTAASYNTIFNTIGKFPFTYEITLP